MNSGGEGEGRPSVDWTYPALIVLRIACWLAVIYGFVKQQCDPLFRTSNLHSTSLYFTPLHSPQPLLTSISLHVA